MKAILFSALACLLATANATFLFPLGYDFMHLENQTVHSPAVGAGFLFGEQDIPFNEVENRFLGLALYRTFKEFHRIDAIFDGRIDRHQFLFLFKSASDKPVVGGLHTIQSGVGYGYEIIRKPRISVILGGALTIGDFTSSGVSSPVLPLPLIRFGTNTQWFVSSFDFLTGPNFSFTLAPKEKFRLTGDMRMDYYRNINDLICEYTVWYRLFDSSHRFGDFAGIGAGFKNDSKEFTISGDKSTFELQQSSVFMAVDLSLLSIQGGWVFDSRNLTDGKKTGSYGNGFLISAQGVIPIKY